MKPDLIEPPYPFQRLLGFEITDWTEGRCRLQQPMRPEIGNRFGIPHGGVHASLLDTVMGFSGCYTGSASDIQQAMTLSLTISYLSQPRGKWLIAEGWRIGGGKSTFFAESKLSDEDGNLIAKGSGTFRYRRKAASG